MFHAPEKYRVKNTQFATTIEDGNNGLFLLPYGSNILQCIISDGMDWEHVSVGCITKNRQIVVIPDWEQMCFIKDIFWDEEDMVIQIHPKKSEYVNQHPSILHLWRPTNVELPSPKSIMVGFK